MPYDPTKGYASVPPGRLASYRGLVVFHCYSTGDIRQEDHYWYQLFPNNDPTAGDPYLFDIRDLPNPQDFSTMRTAGHPYILKEAIDGKVLPPKEWLERVGWKFKLKDSK